MIVSLYVGTYFLTFIIGVVSGVGKGIIGEHPLESST